MSGFSGLRIPFGERDGQLFSPNEVDSGLACKCSCPECGGALLANHPRTQKSLRHRRAYFSHHNVSNCTGGPETAIHKMAKQVLVEACRVVLPPHTVHNVAELTLGATIENRVHFPSRESKFKSVVMEAKDESGLVPDVTAVLKNDATLFIEIFVTHAVDERKAHTLDNLMEIDLSRLSEEVIYDYDAFTEAVLSGAPRRWHRVSLFDDIDRVKEARKKLKDQARKEISQRSRGSNDSKSIKTTSEASKLKQASKLSEWTNFEFWSRVENASEWAEAVDPSSRREELKRRSEKSIRFARIRLLNFFTNDRWPKFLDSEVDNDWFIEVDRRVWQSFVFEEYVLNKEHGAKLDAAMITQQVLSIFGVQGDLSSATCLYKSLRNTPQLTDRARSLMNAPDLAVVRYLDLLDKSFGFLKYDLGTHQYSVVSRTVDQALLEMKKRRKVAFRGANASGGERPGSATLKALLGEIYYR